MKKLLLISIAVLFVAGCSTTMVPVGASKPPGQPAPVDIIVGQEYPRFHRSDPFTPISVTVRNNTGKWIHLRHGQFTLFDPSGQAFVIAPVREVHDWLRYGRWDLHYGPWYPRPVGDFVFREGRLKPGKQLQTIMFFNQATRFGQGTYRLVANIPQNGRPLEFTFRLD
jgi:hypothetical protein